MAIGGALAPFAATLLRAGHQAGALSPWQHPGLLALGVPVACLRQYLRLHNLVVRLVARDELCRRYRKGVVAVARKLAVVMHAMPRDGTFYADRPHPDDAARRRRIASISSPTHQARRSLQPQIGARLERLASCRMCS